jgi:PAS domain S-box-containing protein
MSASTRDLRRPGILLGGLGLVLVATDRFVGSDLSVAALASGVAGAALWWRADRRRERALRRLKTHNDDLAFYARMVNATTNALLTTDAKGRVTWVNEAYERTTGWRLEEVRGRRPEDFVSGPATDPETVQQVVDGIAAGGPIRVELATYQRDGSHRWVTADVAPLHDTDGDLEGYFAVLTDITERREAEQILVEARRAAEETARQKTAFLTTMSHEIRTPLNAVLGLTDLLLLTELGAEQRDYVETAHRSGSHLLNLINDLLDHSALEAGRLQPAQTPFSLASVLGETAAMLAPAATARGIELRTHLTPDVPASLLGDQARLRQVLVNLVGNAVKFTECGSVVVQAQVVRRREDADGQVVHEILTTVTDTGIGIPQWRIPDLFQSFVRGDASTTRQYGGSGLGLAISRGLVEAMGGSVELESELGRGTRVLVRTEHRAAAPPPLAAAGTCAIAGGAADAERLSVLVAEDDAVNRKVVVGMLDRLGIVPSVVGNGRDAVDLVERVDVDVVLMDVEMPVMDGVSAVRRIRDSPGRRPYVIALTANALRGDRERFLEAGMDDYLSKPVTLESLTAALGRAGAAR